MGWFGRKKPPQAQDGSEKRRAPRVPVFEVTDMMSTDERVQVTVKDISAVGIRFASNAPLTKDSVIKVKIQYNPIEFVLRAVVMWHRQVKDGEWDNGAEFVNVPADEKLLLEDHLETLKEMIAAQEQAPPQA